MSKKISCLLMFLTVCLCALSVSGVYAASSVLEISEEQLYNDLPEHIQFIGADFTHGWGARLPLSLRAQAIVLSHPDAHKITDVFSTTTLFAIDAFWPQSYPEVSEFEGSNATQLKEKLNSWLVSYQNIVVMTLPELDELNSKEQSYLKSSKGKRLKGALDIFSSEKIRVNVGKVNKILRTFASQNPDRVILHEFASLISSFAYSEVNSKRLFTKSHHLSELGQKTLITDVLVPSIQRIYNYENIRVSSLSDESNNWKEQLTANKVSWRNGYNGYYNMRWLQVDDLGTSDLQALRKSPLTQPGITQSQISALKKVANYFSKYKADYNRSFNLEVVGDRIILHFKKLVGFPKSLELHYSETSDSFVGWASHEWSNDLNKKDGWRHARSIFAIQPAKAFVNYRFEAKLLRSGKTKLALGFTVLPQAMSHGFIDYKNIDWNGIGRIQPITQGSRMNLPARWQKHFEESYKLYPRLEYSLEANID